MSDPHQIEKDLRDYLEKEPNLRPADRLAFLMAIFNKHFEISKLEHVIHSYDLLDIISLSKNTYSKQKTPMFISRRRIEPSDLPTVAMIEAFSQYLNSMNLLKKIVKLDYKD